jgi:hypothetical protein
MPVPATYSKKALEQPLPEMRRQVLPTEEI